jgi:hypothetical protein
LRANGKSKHSQEDQVAFVTHSITIPLSPEDYRSRSRRFNLDCPVLGDGCPLGKVALDNEHDQRQRLRIKKRSPYAHAAHHAIRPSNYMRMRQVRIRRPRRKPLSHTCWFLNCRTDMNHRTSRSLRRRAAISGAKSSMPEPERKECAVAELNPSTVRCLSPGHSQRSFWQALALDRNLG